MNRTIPALACSILFALVGAALAEDYWWKVEGGDCEVWSDDEVADPTVTWTGDCIDGKVAGFGMLEWSIGGKIAGAYEGEMDEGKLNGYGTLKIHYPSGEVDQIEGYFENGDIAGGAIVTDAAGNVYEGPIDEDGKPHGTGYATVEGEEYAGEFENGVRQGLGYLLSKDEFYIGEFEQNVASGGGMLEDADGGRFHGEFRDGHPHGYGTYIAADGTVYQGRFVDGKADGTFLVSAGNNAEPTVEVWKDGEKVK